MSHLNSEATKLDFALEKFIIAMRLFISAELKRIYGDDWEKKYVQSLSYNQQEDWGKNLQEVNDPIELIDFGNLISFSIKQKDFFRDFFGKKVNNLPTKLSEISEARNIKAHYQSFDKLKANMAYGHMIQIAEKLCMNELKDEIAKLQDGAAMVIKRPTVRIPTEIGRRYESANLTFKRDIIEPLGMDDEFAIYVSNDGGSYTMSKGDFYRVFSNVVNSKSYLEYGIYSYTITPQKTKEFFQIQGEAKNIDKKTGKANSPDNLESTHNKSGKIGTYVRSTLRELINDDLINLNEIERLQGAGYSKTTFDIQFPFLAKENSKYYDYKRYYVNPYLIKGELYFLCSQWYEIPSNNDRPFYEKWLKKMKN